MDPSQLVDNAPGADAGVSSDGTGAGAGAPTGPSVGGVVLQGTSNGKRQCRMHGGKSTGPRTPDGLERSRKANWKHGYNKGNYLDGDWWKR